MRNPPLPSVPTIPEASLHLARSALVKAVLGTGTGPGSEGVVSDIKSALAIDDLIREGKRHGR